MTMSAATPFILGILKATAVLLVAMGLTIALRRAPAGARYVVWLATLVALLLVPAMNVWAPFRLAVLPAEPSSTLTPTATEVPVVEPRAESAGALRADRSPVAVPASSEASSPSLMTIVLTVWLAIVLLLLTWLAFGAAKVRRIMRGARTLTTDAWLTPLYETADRLELDDVPRLVMSPGIEMPFACSLRHPTIVLPESAEQWSDERRRVVLFHELAHIRRRDLFGHTLGRIVCAVYWFHPLVWSAAKRLRAESERACDDLVLASGARASDYAGHLLDIVTGVRRQGAPATALPMADKREFEGRMLAILDPAVKRASPSRGQQTLLACGLGALALSLAAVAPVRREREQRIDDRRVTAAPPSTAREVGTAIAKRFVTSESTITTSDLVSSSNTVSAPPQPSQGTPPSPDTRQGTPLSIANAINALVQSAVPIRTPSALLGVQQDQQQQPDTALLGAVLRKDRDPGVRKVAAWALQGRRDGVPLLVERLRVDEDEWVREMAAWGLAGNESAAVIDALSNALRRDRSDEVRATAAWALGNTNGRADLALLVAALDDANEEVRRRALWAIGNQRLEKLPPKVVAMLKDPDSEVRLMTGWVLGQVTDPSTIPAVREAFLVERDSQVAEALIRALLFMGDRSQAVIDRAMASEEPEMRARGVRMIAGQGAGVWPWPWPWPQPRPRP